MGRMRMSGGSPVRMLRGDAAEALDKAHHARARAAAGGAGRQDTLRGELFWRLYSTLRGEPFPKTAHVLPVRGMFTPDLTINPRVWP